MTDLLVRVEQHVMSQPPSGKYMGHAGRVVTQLLPATPASPGRPRTRGGTALIGPTERSNAVTRKGTIEKPNRDIAIKKPIRQRSELDDVPDAQRNLFEQLRG